MGTRRRRARPDVVDVLKDQSDLVVSVADRLSELALEFWLVDSPRGGQLLGLGDGVGVRRKAVADVAEEDYSSTGQRTSDGNTLPDEPSFGVLVIGLNPLKNS